MKNGDNKTRLVDLIVDVITSNSAKVLNILRTTELFISTEIDCISVSMSSISSVEFLVSNHEEADIKMILHCLYALKEKDTTVILRSPSADTDITPSPETTTHPPFLDVEK